MGAARKEAGVAAAAAASMATVAAAWTAAAGAAAAAAAGGGGGGGGCSGNEGSVGTGGLQPRAVSLRYVDQSNTGQVHYLQPRPPVGPQKLIKYWSNTGQILVEFMPPAACRRPSGRRLVAHHATQASAAVPVAGQVLVKYGYWSAAGQIHATTPASVLLACALESEAESSSAACYDAPAQAAVK